MICSGMNLDLTWNTRCLPSCGCPKYEVSKQQRKLDIAEDDIALINRRLDDSQGIYVEHSLHQCACNLSLTLKIVLYEMCMNADGAAAVEALRAELARVEEQDWFSDAVAEEASAELKAEQAARRQDKENMSTMAHELENAASRCKLLEKENEAKTAEPVSYTHLTLRRV